MYLLQRSVIVFLSQVPMGATGFGDAIVLYVILSFFGSTADAADTSELNEIIFLLTVGGIGSLGVQTWMLWRQINWSLALWLLIPTVTSCMAGLSLLEHLEDYALTLKHLLGFIFLGAALYKVRSEVNLILIANEEAKNAESVLEGPLDTNTNTFWTFMAAISSGALAGIYGTPSPPLMVWISSYNVPKDEWRAVNAIVWLIVNIFRLFHIALLQSEYKHKDVVQVGSFLCAIGVFGAVVGAELSKWIGEYSFRIFIIVLLIFGANAMLFSGRPAVEPLFGVVATFLTVVFYSFYKIVLDKLPDYPQAHKSGAEQFFVSAAGFLGVRNLQSTADSRFVNVKYSAVQTIDVDEDDPDQVASI